MRRFTYAFLAMLIAAAGILSAQQSELANPLRPTGRKPRIYVGPVGGYNKALHSSGFQSVAGDVLCPQFESGTKDGYYAGLSAEYLLGNPKDSKSSIIARVVYNYMPAAYTVPGDKLPSVNPNDTGVVISEVQHVAEIEYSLLDIELIYKLNLFESNFGIVIGPTVGIPLGTTLEQRMELVSPLNATFDKTLVPDGTYINNDRGIITRAKAGIDDESAVRIGVKAGVQYEIPIGRLVLVPCAYYNFGITKLSASNNLRVNALQFGVDLRFAL